MKGIGDYLLGLAAIVAVTLGGTLLRDDLGLPAIALLYLLPVLATAMRGRIGAGLFAAVAGALAYNFFLLPPRFTLQVHGYDNLVTFFVLLAVALVTGRLAAALARREAAAEARAKASVEAATLAAELAMATSVEDAERRGLALLAPQFGTVARFGEDRSVLSALDQAAVDWARENGEPTGHGTGIMPAADWTFAPMGSGVVLGAERAGGELRSREEVERLGELARLIGQARDRLALGEERRERQRLEERDALLRTLLTSLAHDLRTPLTVLRTAMETGRPDETRAPLRRLEQMLGNLLDAARIEAGSVGAALEPVDLVDVVQSALDDCRDTLETRRVEIDVAPGLPLVRADPVLLRHVLANLLDNAARHAEERVMIDAEETSEGVTLRIGDDGNGIEAGQEMAIFERFVRFAGDDRTGSGLGLAIVKGFAEAMGVCVSAANRASGSGAVFTLSLPRVTR